ncbi:MAG TPA: hypothetical protein VHM24_05915 [Gemmatimonadaceae bacterium]|nr:hypothetical protein [Gemmatimonadaceae bacterium]
MMSPDDRHVPPKKGEWNDGEFESFLADIAPALEQGVGRLGVAGSLGGRSRGIDPAKIIAIWPDVADRVVEDLR